MSSSEEASPLTQIIVGIGIVNIGLAVLAFAIIPDLKNYWRIQQWPSTQATLTQVKHDSYQTEYNKTIYELFAEYDYQVNGIKYRGNEAHELEYERIKEFENSKSTGQAVPVYYNPELPSDSVLFRDLDLEQIGSLIFFVFVFGAMGAAAAWSGYKKFRYQKSRNRRLG